jgi:hypothetical protein
LVGFTPNPCSYLSCTTIISKFESDRLSIEGLYLRDGSFKTSSHTIEWSFCWVFWVISETYSVGWRLRVCYRLWACCQLRGTELCVNTSTWYYSTMKLVRASFPVSKFVQEMFDILLFRLTLQAYQTTKYAKCAVVRAKKLSDLSRVALNNFKVLIYSENSSSLCYNYLCWNVQAMVSCLISRNDVFKRQKTWYLFIRPEWKARWEFIVIVINNNMIRITSHPNENENKILSLSKKINFVTSSNVYS